MKRIAIVGGGISGLACANELKKLGFNPLVFEKESRVGGRTTSVSRDGMVFDTGAHVASKGYTSTLELCKELGIEDTYKRLGKNVHFYLVRKGEKNKIAPSSIFLLPLSFFSKFKIFLLTSYLCWKSRNHDFFDAMKQGIKIETGSAKKYLLRYVDQKTWEEFFEPVLYAYTSYNLEDLNLTAFLEIFNQIKKYRHEVYFCKNGMSTLCNELSKKVDVKCNHQVQKVIPCGNGVRIETDKGKDLFDAAVLAVETPQIKLIYSNQTHDPELLNKTEYKTIIIAAFTVPAELFSDLPLIAFSPSTSPLINSCLCPQFYTEQTSLLQNKTILIVYLREQASLKLMNTPDNDINNLIVDELLRILPFLHLKADQIVPFEIKKWERSLPSLKGETTKLALEFWEKEQGINKVYFCGDYLNTPYVEGSIRSGKKVAQLLKNAEERRLI